MKKKKKFEDYQAVILAGGMGTRLSEYTNRIPKPMVRILDKPIIIYIIEHYISYGIKNFIIATGYKSKILEDYLKKKNNKNLDIKIVFTGIKTKTGLRIKKLQKFINKENFFLTYGDGLCSVNLNQLYNFHKKNKKIATMTAVHPPARFGEVYFTKNLIQKFEEKNQLNNGWINGGFFIFKKEFFEYLNNSNVMLEREPIKKLVKKKQIVAFKHKGFWACMDNLRDKTNLEKLFRGRSYLKLLKIL
tara:strand:- start:10 stop:747 length:738 start_codon:yes stop_codon:yes gene_type:complete